MRSLGRRSRRSALLGVLDAALALVVCALAYRLRFEDVDVPAELRRSYVAVSIVTAIGWVAAAMTSGLSGRQTTRPGQSNLEDAFGAAVVVGVGLLLVNPTVFDGELSRAWIGLTTFGLVIAGLFGRGVVRRTRRVLVPFGIGLERYVLVGRGLAARRLLGDLTRASGAPYRIVDTLASDLPAERLAARAVELGVDGLIVPDGELGRDTMTALATALSGTGIDVLLAPGVAGLELRVASVAMLHGVPLLRAAGQAPRRRAQRRRATGTAQTRGVAIMGTRGVPANYGGFETFAERLALSYVDRGIPVTVYCRSHYATAGREWRGVRLVTLPTVRSKYFDTVVHTALSVLHLVTRTRIREVVLCNAANAPVLPFLRLAGRRVVLNVDGLEWRRGKWGIAGRAWYRMGEWLSVRAAAVLVTDAAEVQTYYRIRHDTDSVMIPYGAEIIERGAVPVPADLGVRPHHYALYVSRWESENNPELVAQAHADSGIALPLVMLGQATYDASIEDRVRAVAADHAVLPGALYGDAYAGLQANAACYIHATEVGGTHPALIEALGAGNICLVMDTPENREVVGEHGRYFADVEGLSGALIWVESLTDREAAARRRAAQVYAHDRYSWSEVCRSYHRLTGVPDDTATGVRPPGR